MELFIALITMDVVEFHKDLHSHRHVLHLVFQDILCLPHSNKYLLRCVQYNLRWPLAGGPLLNRILFRCLCEYCTRNIIDLSRQIFQLYYGMLGIADINQEMVLLFLSLHTVM